MRVIIQVVKSSSVTVGEMTNSIAKGYNLLVAISESDSENEVYKVAEKISKLRLFSDENGKINLSIADVQGEILSISQFTLYGDCAKGNRPSFTKSAKFEQAKSLYDLFNEQLRSYGLSVETGFFGEDMIVNIENDGPVTLIIDTDHL